MTIAANRASKPRKPLRLWPGVVAVVLVWLFRFGLKAVVPGFEGFRLGMLGSLFCTGAVLLWWLFWSRAAWVERLGALALMIVGLVVAWGFKHESMGPLWLVGYALPILLLAFVGWAVLTRRLADGPRRVTMVATLLLACTAWTLVRTEGITGDHVAQFTWRWRPTAEETLLDAAGGELASLAPPSSSLSSSSAAPAADEELPAVVQGDEPPAPQMAAGVELVPPPGAAEPAVVEFRAAAEDAPPVPVPPAPSPSPSAEPAAWPGFRGAGRDGIVHGMRIATDWATSPPVELWRRPVGPGWSSFAVDGDRLYTQEQRGEDEVVSCYDASTGEPVWQHADAVRFFESNAGAGPRGTPAVDGGRVYTLGATGIVNALDAADGALAWSRDAAADTGAQLPDWGFSGSPLVVGDTLIVAASGTLIAYDLATGEPRWHGPAGGLSYSSPQLVTIDGVEQVLMLNADGLTSVAPADGAVLWDYPWPGFPITQPALTADGGLLLAASGGSGTRRIALAHRPAGWSVEERWTSLALKPYFNDFVVHRGHAYGFDGRILACLDLADGSRSWKGGRYGNGQLVLLADQDLLLVLSEQGELALVAASPEGFTELARRPAIAGKSWNHPALVGDLLLVRNGREMAAYRLALADD